MHLPDDRERQIRPIPETLDAILNVGVCIAGQSVGQADLESEAKRPALKLCKTGPLESRPYQPFMHTQELDKTP